MALNLGQLVATITADDSRFQRTLGRVHSTLQRTAKVAAFTALSGSAIQLAAALAPAVGILAALPAAAFAAGTAMVALKLALSGVGEVLGTAVSGDAEKFEEALKKLPPVTRSVARELGTALFGLQKRVQEAFFLPVSAQARGLGNLLRGPIQNGMAKVGTALGGVAAGVVKVAKEGRSIAFLRGLFRATAAAIDGMGKGLPAFVRGLRDMAGAFLGDIGKAGAGLGSLLEKAGLWMSRMAKSGRAMGWVHGALAVFRQLGGILGNLGSALRGIFGAASGEGESFLTTIERLSARFATWVNSTKGQDQLGRTFAFLGQVARDVLMVLGAMVVIGGQVAAWFSGLPAPVQSAVSQFLALSIALALVAGKLGPLFKGLGLVAGGVGKLARALGDPSSKLRQFAARAGAVAAAGLRMAGQMALAAGRVMLSWTLMAARSVISAAIMAGSWLIAFWPVALIVAAAAIAVALIIKYWDKIVAFFTKTLPKWLKQGAAFVMTIIKNMAKYGFLGPIGLIVSHWDKIVKFFTKTLPSAVSNGVSNVIGWLQRLPGRVLSAVGDMGKLLVNAGKNLLIGLWNGLVSMASWLARSIGNLIRNIVPGPVLRVLGIASPSKLFAGYGKNVAQGMALGMQRNQGLVSAAAGALAGAAAGAGGAMTVGRPAPVGAAAGRGGPVVVESRLLVDSNGSQLDRAIVEIIRKAVKNNGRGDVQIAFGRT